MTTKLLARLDASTCNSRRDASISQGLSTEPKVISLVSIQLARSLPWSPPRTTNWLNSINRFLQHLAVVDVSRRMRYRERDSLSVDHRMALRARFSAIRRVRPGLFALRGQEHSPNRARPATSRFGRILPDDLAVLGGPFATHLLLASHASVASKSCRFRIPFLWEAVPKECLYGARKECR